MVGKTVIQKLYVLSQVLIGVFKHIQYYYVFKNI